MVSKTPPRPPKTPPEASRRLQDVQDRLQGDSKIAQEASKRLPDASKTAKIASKTPPRLSNRLPNAFLAPEISSKPVRTSPKRPPRRSISLPRPSKVFGSCFKSLLACQAHANYCQVLAKSLPGSQVFQRCFVRSGQTQRPTAMAMAVYQGWSGGVCPLGRLR